MSMKKSLQYSEWTAFVRKQLTIDSLLANLQCFPDFFFVFVPNVENHISKLSDLWVYVFEV